MHTSPPSSSVSPQHYPHNYFTIIDKYTSLHKTRKQLDTRKQSIEKTLNYCERTN